MREQEISFSIPSLLFSLMGRNYLQPEQNAIKKYMEQSLRYLENGLISLNQGDYDEASEFLWGSIAQAVKAIAATKGMELKTHRELWEFTRELTKEMGDPNIYEAFRTASYLHTNFYEVELGPEEVILASDNIRAVVGRLLKEVKYEAS